MRTDIPYSLPGVLLVLLLVFSAILTLTIRESEPMSHRSFTKEPLFLRLSPIDLFAYSFSFLILCFLCGLVIYFRQQSEPVSQGPLNTAAPVSAGPLASSERRGKAARASQASAVPAVGHLPSHPQPFADSIDSDFYQTIIRNNLFAPLGTVLNAEPEPGAHLSLLGTFVSEDPSASSVLVKNATTGRHHLLSVGEGVGEFHVLAVEPKQVRFYHHGTEVSLHLSESENLFLNTNRR